MQSAALEKARQARGGSVASQSCLGDPQFSIVVLKKRETERTVGFSFGVGSARKVSRGKRLQKLFERRVPHSNLCFLKWSHPELCTRRWCCELFQEYSE
jgi:hypothetical protein